MAIKNIKFGSPIYAPKAVLDSLTVKGTSTIENSTEVVVKDALIVLNPEGEAAEATLLGQVILTGEQISTEPSGTISGEWKIDENLLLQSTRSIQQKFSDCVSLSGSQYYGLYNDSGMFTFLDYSGDPTRFYYKNDSWSLSSITLIFNTPNKVSQEFIDWMNEVAVRQDTPIYNEKAYGILYDPAEDVIKLGLGVYETASDTFSFSDDQGLPIAIRDFSVDEDGRLVIWNAEKACLEAAPVFIQGKNSLVHGSGTSVSDISQLAAVFGSNNTLNGHKTLMTGGNNTADQTDLAIIGGSENTVVGDANLVAGRENVVTVTRSNLVVGHKNKVGTEPKENAEMASGDTPDGTIDGASNFIGSNLVGGHKNTVTGSDNIVAGKENVFDGDSAIIAGNYNAPVENALLILGNGELPSGASEPTRQNAFYVTSDGKAYVTGDKPLATEEYVVEKDAALTSELANIYVKQEIGKGLSVCNFTDEYKAYLDGVISDATVSSTGSLVAGTGNSGSTVANTAVFGANNIDVGGHNIVGGKSNSVSKDLNIVGGQQHNVTGVANIIGGRYFDVSSRGNIVGGMYNNITGSDNDAYGSNIMGGYNNTITGGASANLGSFNLVIGKNNIVESANNIVGGTGNTIISGNNTICAGYKNAINASNSIALGTRAQVDGSNSVCIGAAFTTDRDDIEPDAEGNFTLTKPWVRENHSVAIGGAVQSLSEFSAVFGYGTVSTEKAQFVVGKYNIMTHIEDELMNTNDSTQLFIVGNGSKAKRANAFSINTTGANGKCSMTLGAGAEITEDQLKKVIALLNNIAFDENNNITSIKIGNTFVTGDMLNPAEEGSY